MSQDDRGEIGRKQKTDREERRKEVGTCIDTMRRSDRMDAGRHVRTRQEGREVRKQ